MRRPKLLTPILPQSFQPREEDADAAGFSTLPLRLEADPAEVSTAMLHSQDRLKKDEDAYLCSQDSAGHAS